TVAGVISAPAIVYSNHRGTMVAMFHVLELIVIILLLLGMLGVLLRFFLISLRRTTGVQPRSAVHPVDERRDASPDTRGVDPWVESARRMVVDPEDPASGSRPHRGGGAR
ncbi:MAG: hypothetical protein VX563_02205, partial [Planctomycetota bacterium]|nr:hypothetical protein [Planctomycetota bacterium]